MEVVLGMHVCKTLKGLKEYVSDQMLRKQLLPFLHDFIDVLIEILKYKVQTILLQDNLVKQDNVWVRKLDQ